MIFNKLRKSFAIIPVAILSLAIISGNSAMASGGPSLNQQEGFGDGSRIENAFNPDGGESATIGEAVGNIINIALGFLGIIFVVLLVIAGFKYFTAQGNSTKTTEAIGSIKTAIIGLIIILMSYAITTFVMQNAINVTSGG